jgi:glutamyl-tRNA reductase
MIGDLFYLGVTHRASGADWRGRFRCDEAMRRGFLHDLADLAFERLIVSTCGRFEIYGLCEHREGSGHDADDEVGRIRSRLIERVCGWFGLAFTESAPHFQFGLGDSAAGQLLQVAAGLDSRIPGEPQILGQVRNSFEEAVRAGGVGPILSALCRAAIHTGKRVRRETAIQQTAESSATLAVEFVQRQLGTVRDRTVVLLGTGHLARDVVSALAGRGARLFVVGREVDAAGRIASSAGGRGVGFDRLGDLLAECDGVLVCTASPTFLIEPGLLSGRARPLTIVDLAVPRNVDPAVAETGTVELVHLDELMGFSRAASRPDSPLTEACVAGTPVVHRSMYADAERAARDIVQAELQRFLDWRRHRLVAGQIEQLVRRTEMQIGGEHRAERRRLHEQILALKASVAA